MPTQSESGKPPERATDAFPRWVWLVSAGLMLLIGWLFILMFNNFHLTAPVVIACLAFAAGVSSIYALFRVGSSAVSEGVDEDDDASWGRPIGARGELEREKRALLKAIKEVEFDLHMGKLSKADAEEMIGTYRAQAIVVIREIDRKDGDAATAREQIEREVRARIEVAKSKKLTEGEKKPGKKGGKKKGGAAKKTEDQAEAIIDRPEKVEEIEEEVAAKVEEEAAAKAEEAPENNDEATAPAAAPAADAVLPDPSGAEARAADQGKEATP
jgi:hypothetical protein